MAKSGEKSVTVTQWDTLKFTWTVSSQSVSENASTVDWSLNLISGSVGKIDSTASKSWTVTIDGQKFSGSNTVGIGNNSTLKLASGSVKLKHGADGTKSFNYSFAQSFDIVFSGSKIGTINGSGSGSIDQIYSITTPTINTTEADIGTDVVISLNNNNTALTHDLAYKFGGLDWVTFATNVRGDYKWSIPMDLVNLMTHTDSIAADIRCITKSGSQALGTKTTSLMLKVPESVVPVISSVTITEATESLSEIGVYVQGKSTLNVSIQAEGVRGSTIKDYSSTFEKKTYKDSSWVSDEIRGSGEINITVVVTDTRGRKAEITETVTAFEYASPTITDFHVVRCHSDGTESESGQFLKAYYAYNVTSLDGHNTALAEIRYKPYGQGEYTEAPIFSSGEIEASNDFVFDLIEFDTDKSYDIKLTLTDAIGNKTEKGDVLESDSVIIDIKADGTGISLLEFCGKPGVTIRGQIPRSAKYLTEGTDLNDLWEPGFYYITKSVMPTILNRPSWSVNTHDAVIEVLGTTSEGTWTVRQIYREIFSNSGDNDCKICERIKPGDWACIYAGRGNLLWSGSEVMGEGSEIELADLVSHQPNGICLTFSHHTGNYFYNTFFIPKMVVSGAWLTTSSTYANCSFTLASDGLFSSIGSKRLNISNNKITGIASNTANGTASNTGITYNNNVFHLRLVVGV